MLKSWTDYFQDLIIDRVIEIDETVLSRNPQYKTLETEIAHILAQLLEILPPEQHTLVFDCESTQVTQTNLSNEVIYRQAFLDGLRLGYLFDRIRTSRE